MRIKSLSIKNNFLGWEFEEINFTSNLTLLVGGSGVGKTQILNAINDLKNIVNGVSINGLEWSIVFSIDSGEEYKWEGGFEKTDNNKKWYQGEEIEVSFMLLYERLTIVQNNKIIAERKDEFITFQGNVINLKLSPTQSLLHILANEESIKNIVSEFNKINLKDNTGRKENHSEFSVSSLSYLKIKYRNIEDIKNSNESTQIKLLLCSELKLEVFNLIINRFIDIFPQVKNIKIETHEIPGFEFVDPIIYIKEKGVTKWIKESHISSGMIRTLIHIAELFLSSDGSVILIDEFENSLGVNCIDILTDDLIHENRTIQFIATSHHPYIINNIPYEYWKIVSRKGGKISVRNAAAHKLGKSKQAAFLQLTKILEKQAAAI